ncbi:GAT domain containing protein [Trema orientale]|uniref:GAT domain containing protein n=1 Tax=Trema orientale TaxID=63057 RepID=A0A2P5E865_TREOI|nr:GAT domain containing protein [Trema orientale]
MKSRPFLNFLPNSRTHDDVTLSLLDTCKESQHVIKGIIERTTDDEGMLSEALHLHDDLQQIISKV